MNVEERMTRKIVSCRVEDPLTTAVSRMWNGDYGCLPVLDWHGRALGIVSDRGACAAVLRTAKSLHGLRVADAMQRVVATTHLVASLQEAESTMLRHRVSALPVLDRDGRVVGMLCRSDLANSCGGVQLADRHTQVDAPSRTLRRRRGVPSIRPPLAAEALVAGSAFAGVAPRRR